MTRQTGGTKRSSWLTFRRRLLLVRLLLRAPMCGADLIAAVRSELGDEAYPEAATSALKHDLDALKSEFGCAIRFQRTAGCYALEDLGELALLDLPDDSMEALAFLEASFPADGGLANQAGLRTLLDRIMLLFPAARREQHHRRRSAVTLDLVGRAPSRIDPDVLAVVKRAIERRQELVFDYRGLYDGEEPRHHHVAPYGIFFRPEGHGYLDATLLEVTPAGREPRHAAIEYRLDRVVPGSARVLPRHLPPQRIAAPSYTLRYRLVPEVARRRDVATYFPNTCISYQEDGSATITATITNLWQARQILLRYGSGCVVLEPSELIDLFRETVDGLVRLYRGTE